MSIFSHKYIFLFDKYIFSLYDYNIANKYNFLEEGKVVIHTTATQIRKDISDICNKVSEGEVAQISRYEQNFYLLNEEDYKLFLKGKRQEEKEQQAINEALAPYAKAIEENLANYPLTEEEYEEHLKRFERAIKHHTHVSKGGK